MNINLTKEQYQTLLKMIYCGEWILNSYKVKEDKISKETNEIEQYIFSYAKEYGFDSWIEYDNEYGKYFPTALMEEEVHTYILTYNEKQKEK